MLIFIVNPNSGGQRSYKTWLKLSSYLHDNNLEHEVFITKHADDIKNIIQKLTLDKKIDNNTLVIIGGDGTVNEVINAVDFSHNTILGYIPAGTGNDLARGLEFNKNIKKNVRNILLHNTTKSVDTCVAKFSDVNNSIDEKKFIVSCGIGYDAEIINSYFKLKSNSPMSKGLLRKIAYIIIGVKTFFKNKKFSSKVFIDDKIYTYNNTRFISAQIQKSEGGGFAFAPDAINDDGKMDLCIVDTDSLYEFALVLINALLGNKIHCKCIKRFVCDNASIELDELQYLHADGEKYDETKKISFSCLNKSVKFIV